jgi:electron transport complex protein RnfG
MRKMIIVLTAVMVLSGLVLAATFSGLSSRIEANREAALNASLASIFSSETDGDLRFEELESGGPTIYRATTGAADALGFAVRVQAQGYGGTITMLVGLSTGLDELLGIEVVEQVETPGLGGNITDDSFKRQFVGLDAAEPIGWVKNVEPDPGANEIQAISGATITSKAVVSGMNNTLADAIDTIRRQAQ